MHSSTFLSFSLRYAGRDPRRDGVFRTVERREIGGKSQCDRWDVGPTKKHRFTTMAKTMARPGPTHFREH